MVKKQEDRRTQYTKLSIRNALLELMAHQCFTNISISKLCRQAQISRGTFYLHYQNTTQVLNEILEEIFDQLDAFPSEHYCETSSVKQCTYPMCQFLREHSEYHTLLTEDELSSYFVNRLIRSRGPAMIEKLKTKVNLKEKELETLLYFQIHGCFAVSKRSLNCSSKDWCPLQQMIDCFIKGGLDALSQKDHS